MTIENALWGERLLKVIEKGGLVYQNSYDFGTESHLSVHRSLEEFAMHFKLNHLIKGNYRVTIIMEPVEKDEE
jgi:hypothetical protein